MDGRGHQHLRDGARPGRGVPGQSLGAALLRRRWCRGRSATSRSRGSTTIGIAGYRDNAEADVPATPTFRYWPTTAAIMSYNKTALWLHTLERHLGWPTMQRILSTYFDRWKFRHPRPADFFQVANEVSGQDLTWFFDQVYRSSNTFDYGVQDLAERCAATMARIEPS